MRSLLALMLIMPLVVSGCFDHCGPSSDAAWVEPGLFDTLVARGALPSTTPEGIPFDASALNTSWGDVVLRKIDGPALQRPDVDQGPGHDHRGTLRPTLVLPGVLDRTPRDEPWSAVDGVVVVVRGLDETVEDLRNVTEPFLAALDVTPSDAWYERLASERHEWARSFYRDSIEKVHFEYWAALDATPDVDGLVVALGAENATRDDGVYIEDFYIQWSGGWQLSFLASVVTHTLEGDPDMTIRVNAADGAQVEMPDPYDGNETGGRAWVTRTFEANGLGTPALAAWEWGTDIC